MSDLRDAMRKGQVSLGPEASVRIDGHLVRADATRHTVPPIAARRRAAREARKAARAARRANRRR